MRRKHKNIGKEIREKSSDHTIDRHRVPEFKANSIYLANGINEKINKDFYPNSPIVIYGEMGLELYTKEPTKPDKAVLEIAKNLLVSTNKTSYEKFLSESRLK